MARIPMVEGFHLDMVLGIMIHIGNRDGLSNTRLNFKYLSIVFISILSLLLTSIYFYMGYTVSRLRQAYLKYGLLEVSDMKDEPLRGLLSDKSTKSLFQYHFNLILMLKDVWICSLLVIVYERVTLLLILLKVYQLISLLMIILYPPFVAKASNRHLWITQGMYLLLDIAFLINVGLSMTEEVRYFYVGISMITIVGIIILAKSGSSTYNNIMIIVNKCKKRRSKNKRQSEGTVSVVEMRHTGTKLKGDDSVSFESRAKGTTASKEQSLSVVRRGVEGPTAQQYEGNEFDNSHHGLVQSGQGSSLTTTTAKSPNKKTTGSRSVSKGIGRQQESRLDKQSVSRVEEEDSVWREGHLEDSSKCGMMGSPSNQKATSGGTTNNKVMSRSRIPLTRNIQVKGIGKQRPPKSTKPQKV